MSPLALDLPFSESQNSIPCSVSLEHIFFPWIFFCFWCLHELVEPVTWWVHVYICRSAAQGSSVCIEVTPSLGLGCSPSWGFSSSSCARSRVTLPLLTALPSPGVRLLVPMAPCFPEEEKEMDSGGEGPSSSSLIFNPTQSFIRTCLSLFLELNYPPTQTCIGRLGLEMCCSVANLPSTGLMMQLIF